MGERERERAPFRPRSVRVQSLAWARFYEFVYESVLNGFSGWHFIRVTFYPQHLSILSDSRFYLGSFYLVDLLSQFYLRHFILNLLYKVLDKILSDSKLPLRPSE